MPFSPFSQWVGLAKEATRGTAVTPSIWLPVESPAYNPNLNQIEDKAMRGSMVTVNDLVPGVRDDELDFSSYMYVDTVANMFKATLGSPDNGSGTAQGAPTTLSSPAAAGATTITTVGNTGIVATAVLQVDVGALSELVTVVSISGTGPYTVTITGGGTPAGLQIAHASAVAVQPLNTASPIIHAFSLLNNSGATGNQPPSYTATYYNGFNARQLPAGQVDSMSFTFSPTGIATYKTKIFGYPSVVMGSPPTPAPSNVDAIPSYNCVVTLGGSAITQLADATVDIKRSVKPVPVVGNNPTVNAPYRVWAGPCDVTGKLSLIMEDDTYLLDYLNSVKPSLDLKFTEAVTGATVEFHMNSAMFKTGKPTGGKEVMQVEADYVARPNATDATAGGNSPLKVTVTNSTSTSY